MITALHVNKSGGVDVIDLVDDFKEDGKSATRYAVEVATAFLTGNSEATDRIPSVHHRKERENGSEDYPFCLDSDSENDHGIESSSHTFNFELRGYHKPKRKVILGDSNSPRLLRREGNSNSNACVVERTPDMVIPPGHYFNSMAGKCLPYSPFAINALELKDLFGNDVIDESTQSVFANSFLKPFEVDMHPNLSTQLKPHQKDAVQFLWKNTMNGVVDYPSQEEVYTPPLALKKKSGNTIHGCILAHFMGLGKTLTIISFLTTLM